MLAGLAHLATAACAPLIFERVSLQKQGKEVRVRGVFIVRVVASRTRTPALFRLLFFLSPATVLGSLVF